MNSEWERPPEYDDPPEPPDELEAELDRLRLMGLGADAAQLMFSAIFRGERTAAPNERPVTLTVEYRHDTDSSQWWTLRWGEGQSAADKTMRRCLMRAALMMQSKPQKPKDDGIGATDVSG